MDLNQLVKDLEEIKGCIENDHIEKAEDLLGFVIGEVAVAAQHRTVGYAPAKSLSPQLALRIYAVIAGSPAAANANR